MIAFALSLALSAAAPAEAPQLFPTLTAPAQLAALTPPVAPAPQARTTVFGLPENVGPTDRVARAVVAVGLMTAGAYGMATGDISEKTSSILMGVSAVPGATAATGYCPAYHLFGVDYTF